MLLHILFYVPTPRYEEVVAWYLAVLAPLGYTKQHDFPGRAVSFGATKETAQFWIASKEDTVQGCHIAFNAQNHEAVDKFHAVALEAGGTDNGKPGIRQEYGPNYYAAFIIDPVGNNIEVADREAH